MQLDVIAPPGGVMTDEVGAITGELTLAASEDTASVKVQYKDAAEWYTVSPESMDWVKQQLEGH
ncbi:hypothetical protein [Catelliglobosispora koreensis]|uniref:hypothetical protein n=1 Tax=Catelliglobosispora koreensis TaxID=129052 RepID=UPI000590A4DD|nr:hypothetical protein [Catelliglobosispora koreensis]